MALRLEGSCHCKAVTFTVEAQAPVPFNQCYCEICRKTAGAGGFSINLGAAAESLTVRGQAHIRRYRAKRRDADGAVFESPSERSFCGTCGSALWLWDSRWPELLHPHASAIDTPLPEPPQRWHMMLGSRANWAIPCLCDGDLCFDAYPDESLADWHRRHGWDEGS